MCDRLGVWPTGELGPEVVAPSELCQLAREARQRREGLTLVKAEKKERRKKKKTWGEERGGTKKKKVLPHVQWGLGAFFKLSNVRFLPPSFLNFHFGPKCHFFHTLALLKFSVLILIFQKFSNYHSVKMTILTRKFWGFSQGDLIWLIKVVVFEIANIWFENPLDWSWSWWEIYRWNY